MQDFALSYEQSRWVYACQSQVRYKKTIQFIQESSLSDADKQKHLAIWQGYLDKLHLEFPALAKEFP